MATLLSRDPPRGAPRARIDGKSRRRRNAQNQRHEARWTPDGAGFARVSVIDANGASDSVWVRLE
jgi:hypothetical protein